MSTKKIQILGTIGDKIYKQNEEPVNAAEGDLWIDLDEDGIGEVSGGNVDLDTTLSQSGKAADAKAVGDAIADVRQEVASGVTNEQIDTAVSAYLSENPVSGGLSATAKALLIAILRNAVYNNDQSANIAALEVALAASEVEKPDAPETGVEQSGSILSIISGVTVNQNGIVLDIE